MNTRARTILTTGALAITASALNSQAADQSAFFEQQREMTDGAYTQYKVVPTPARTKPATPYQAAETKWLAAELAQGGGAPQVPFPVPEAPKAKPLTAAEQAAHDKWFKEESAEDDGYGS